MTMCILLGVVGGEGYRIAGFFIYQKPANAKLPLTSLLHTLEHQLRNKISFSNVQIVDTPRSDFAYYCVLYVQLTIDNYKYKYNICPLCPPPPTGLLQLLRRHSEHPPQDGGPLLLPPTRLRTLRAVQLRLVHVLRRAVRLPGRPRHQ